jgi:hypothetical protein
MFHASYTHATVLRLCEDEDRARATLEKILHLERRYYSIALNRILDRFNALGAAPKNLFGKLRWLGMAALARLGLAVPMLPVYLRMPRRIWNDAPAY